MGAALKADAPVTLAEKEGFKAGLEGAMVKNPFAKRGGKAAKDWVNGYTLGSFGRQSS